MKKLKLFMIIVICTFGSCNPDIPGTDTGEQIIDPKYGRIEFDFKVPELDLPDKGLHRVDLSLARSMDSLYRKEFCNAANVSDYKEKYTFVLLPGRYFYQAGIACTCQADSCLYAGFPGGQLSVWWTSGWVDVEKGKVFSKNLNFQ
ncbi:MAG: hypothetical protein WC699_11330 [Bacteroidales bacterium]|jgi:hypothetical protein